MLFRSRELEQHDRSDGGLDNAQGVDLLFHAIFKNEELVFGEARDELVVLVEDDADVQVDEGNIDTKGEGLSVGVLDRRLGGRGRWRRFLGLFLPGNDDGAVIDRRTSRVGGLVGALGGRRRRRGCGRDLRAGGGKRGRGGEDERGQERGEHFMVWANWRGGAHRRFIIAHCALDAALVDMGAPDVLSPSRERPGGTSSSPLVFWQSLVNKRLRS